MARGCGLEVHEAIVGLARTMAREFCLSVGPRYAIAEDLERSTEAA
ncbi:hypothetical protein [Ralstonia mannitolilytica]|nr:hypothetical protein [Ralstonia mannitolilytica]